MYSFEFDSTVAVVDVLLLAAALPALKPRSAASRMFLYSDAEPPPVPHSNTTASAISTGVCLRRVYGPRAGLGGIRSRIARFLVIRRRFALGSPVCQRNAREETRVRMVSGVMIGVPTAIHAQQRFSPYSCRMSGNRRTHGAVFVERAEQA